MNQILEQYREKVSQCVRCGVCSADCPTYEATGDESMVARGRLVLVDAVLNGELELTKGFADRMSKCTSCLICVTACPRGVDPVEIINAAKGEYFKSNRFDFILKLLLRYTASSNKFLYPVFKLLGMANLIYNRLPVEGWLKEVLPYVRNGIKKKSPQLGKRNLKNEVPEIIKVENPKMRVVFFTGCMTDFAYQETGHSIINTLKENNIEIIIPKDIGCCGAPAYYMGDRQTAINLAEKNYKILSRLNPDYIIVNCATCGGVLRSVYKTLLNVNGNFSGFSEKVIDIHKFYTDHLDLNQFKKYSSAKKKIRVTYHDPCHLKRGQIVHTEPREILKSLPWVDFVEMENADACCGGAGGFNLKHYDLSLEIGKKKA